MKILITHINYGEKNAEEKLYISHYHQNQLSHKIHNALCTTRTLQLDCAACAPVHFYMNLSYGQAPMEQSTRWGSSLVKRQVQPRDGCCTNITLFLSVLTLAYDGIFIRVPGGGICLNRTQTGPESLLLPSPGSTKTINLSKFLCLHVGQHNSQESLQLFGCSQTDWNASAPPLLISWMILIRLGGKCAAS